MLLNAELLLHYQRCDRRIFLDTHGDFSQRDAKSELLIKLQQDKFAHRQRMLVQTYHKPDYPKGNWESGALSTVSLMQQGVERIYKPVLLATYLNGFTLLSRPDLLIKQSGKSCFGDWDYVPAQIELGKRPKQEYQIMAAFHAFVLAVVQGVEPSTAWLLLRRKDGYEVFLSKWIPQMQRVLDDCIETLRSHTAPEVFIARQRCNLCRWHSSCYQVAKSEQHLSLLPGVTPNRYKDLQALSLTKVESLANANPAELENLPGFDSETAQKLIIQAQSAVQNRPILLPYSTHLVGQARYLPLSLGGLNTTHTKEVEIYFDIEAEPDLNLDYLLGVLVVDRQAKTEKFYSLLAERPEDESLIWQHFLDLVEQYPNALIYHFCPYEVDTVKRLAKLYGTPRSQIQLLLSRFVDVYEQVTQTLVLPVESYALKAIARWLNFEWRDPQATGAQCIYWYDKWLETSDRTFLDTIQRYNEDDCRATRKVKDWLENFVQAHSNMIAPSA